MLSCMHHYGILSAPLQPVRITETDMPILPRLLLLTLAATLLTACNQGPPPMNKTYGELPDGTTRPEPI